MESFRQLEAYFTTIAVEANSSNDTSCTWGLLFLHLDEIGALAHLRTRFCCQFAKELLSYEGTSADANILGRALFVRA